MINIVAYGMIGLCLIGIIYSKVKTDLDIIDIINKENDE